MKSHLTSALVAVALAASPALAAETFTVDKAHSQAAFQVRHFLSKTGGRFTEFQGTIQLDEARPENSTVEFRIAAASVDTDNPKRDEHLRTADFFDAEKHPEITFRSEKIRKIGKDQYEVSGTFSMRGVEKKLVLPVSFLGTVRDPWGGVRAGFSTTATLNRKDFGMVWNKALDNGGVVLGDEVWVTVELETVRQGAS